MKHLAQGLALVLVCWSVPVWAQSSDAKAAAEALFVEGRNLMIEGQIAGACQKFEASQKLDPGLGTMLNLADCYEKSGRTASAWAEYREAIPAARASGSEERARLAEERARALESRLSTLTIRVMADATGSELEVLRDGIPVDRAVLSTAIPVDPGVHTVVARAVGRKPWSKQVAVGDAGDKVEVEVPTLPTADANAPRAIAATSGSEPPSSWSSQKTWALVSGGVGVAGIGIGAIFGVMAGAELTAAKDGCATYPNGCSASNYAHNDNAQTYAGISTVGLIAGGVGLVLGGVLWLTAPSPRDAVAVGVGPGSLTVKGSF